MYHGIINVYKEAGFTSHDVVAKLRGICKQKKIGHTGTLDPAAVGVLPVCLGNGTGLCEMLSGKKKEYIAVLKLGIVTGTQDTTGQILAQHPVTVSPEEVRRAIASFLGEYDQIPPMYSALKVNGKKLYELARAGKEVPREPRRIQIESLTILAMNLPEVEIQVTCSKGTYIRTLCHDIGIKLGCGGTMASLKRTRSGDFAIGDAYTLSQLETLAAANRLTDAIKPVAKVFCHLSPIVVQEPFHKRLVNGNPIHYDHVEKLPELTPNEAVRIYSFTGDFYGIYQNRAAEGRFYPVRMFLPERF